MLTPAASGEKEGNAWSLNPIHALSKTRQKHLAVYLLQGRIARWLKNTPGSAKASYRSTTGFKDKLGCERMYLFGKRGARDQLLVGAAGLDKSAKDIFQLVVDTLLGEELVSLSEIEAEKANSSGRSVGNYDPDQSLERVLLVVCRALAADAGYLAVRVGGSFQVEALHGLPAKWSGRLLDANENSALRAMQSAGRAVDASAADAAIAQDKKIKDGHWLGAPLIIGRRMIGFLALRRKSAYQPGELAQASLLAKHVAPSVEKTMAFLEAARHLQRFALVNELASLASAEFDAAEVIRRTRRMLRRTLGADQVELLFRLGDNQLLERAPEGSDTAAKPYRIDASLAGDVFISGAPQRIDDIGKSNPHKEKSRARSLLLAPLKFQSETIGVLSLGSREKAKFSEQDENFLVVVASQIASLVENAKLNEDIRQRADILSLINEIVQSVVGLTNITDIAQTTAELLMARFRYELVAIALLDNDKEELVVEGMAGGKLPAMPKRMRYARDLGVPGRVLRTGESFLVHDVTQIEEYFGFPGWEPGAQVCVALRNGEQVFGVINIESESVGAFTENDQLALQTLAGALSSVILYARRYDQLEFNVRQLAAVRETALDISTDLDLDILLRRVVNRVRELVDARGAELALIDHDENLVRVLVSENPWQDYTGYTFPLMSGVAGRVAALGEPFVVADYNAWSGKRPEDFQAPFTTVAGVPLKFSGEVIGTLTVQDDRANRAFSGEDVKTLELLSPQVTVFIRNARLYQELEERIEAQRVAEERLVRSARLAAVGEMAAGVAHELNNPLTTVTGFAELILDELPKDAAYKADLELVLREAQRARDVVRRLLDFSRQSEILRTQVDVNEVLSDALALIHHLARISGVETRIALWDDLPPLRVDRNQMQQVFLNIMHNAIQAMPAGGNLIVKSSVETRNGAHWVAVRVADSGPGIKKEHVAQIFEPFFTTKPSGTGTGLGLSISYGIVSDHGGFIEVESEEGQGAAFTVWLPVEPVAIAEEAEGEDVHA